MDDLRAITAISDASFESLVSRTLFENGWSVDRRLLDARDIHEVGEHLLLISLDIEGLTSEMLSTFMRSGTRVIAFAPNPHQLSHPSLSVHEPLHDPLALLSIIRGAQREPLIQRKAPVSSRSSLLLVVSARPGVGGSFVAANIAMELSTHDKKVLVVDADLDFPSLYEYFGVRDLQSPRALTPHLSVMDLNSVDSQSHLELLSRWSHEYDIVVVDRGTISARANLSSDRRHEGAMTMWGLDHTIKSIVVTTPDTLDMNGHRRTLDLLRAVKPQGRFVTVVNKVEKAGKVFVKENVFQLLRDDRSVRKCMEAKLMLTEAAPRSPLARNMAEFVREGLM